MEAVPVPARAAIYREMPKKSMANKERVGNRMRLMGMKSNWTTRLKDQKFIKDKARKRTARKGVVKTI